MIRVLLCMHNGAKFLEAQVASILAQRTPVDVIHLYDFASADATRAIAARLSSDCPKISVRLVDRAPGPALSFFHALADIALECGEDDKIFLCDQDDIWLPNKVKVMLEVMSEVESHGEKRLLLFHDVTICDEQLLPICSSHYLGRPFLLPRDLAPERLHLVNPVIGHTMLLSWPLVRLAVEVLRPKHYVMHDWALILLAAHCGKVVPISDQLSLYRQHANNILGSGRKKTLIAHARKAMALARDICVQTLAFREDVAKIVGLRDAECTILHRASTRRINFEIARSMLRLGPTVGHRIIGLIMFFNAFKALGLKSPSRSL